MSDATTTNQAGGSDPIASTALSVDRIDAVLNDFRTWLTNLTPTPTTSAPAAERVDLFTLVSQFVALKQEVHLQTRATRAALEKFDLLSATNSVSEPSKDDSLRPILKSLIDVYDALALAGRQLERQSGLFTSMLDQLGERLTAIVPPLPEERIQAIPIRSSWWVRFMGRPSMPESPTESDSLTTWRNDTIFHLSQLREEVMGMARKLRDSLDGVVVGYTMSLNRIDRLLLQCDMETLSTTDQKFDPEWMEVLEVISSDAPSGSVIEEIRRGYRWHGKLFRHALVRVAK